MTLSVPHVLGAGELESLLRQRPTTRVLDVRTPGEFEAHHIAGAYNVPLDQLHEHAHELAKIDELIVLVCQSGSRARQAEAVLNRSGMPTLHVLDGGMNGWLQGGNAVVYGPKRLPLERQVRIAAGALAALGGVLAVAVSPWFALVPVFVGSGLVYAGITDTCGMGLVLSRLPYNRPATCDVDAMVRALTMGAPPRAAAPRSRHSIPA